MEPALSHDCMKVCVKSCVEEIMFFLYEWIVEYNLKNKGHAEVQIMDS